MNTRKDTRGKRRLLAPRVVAAPALVILLLGAWLWVGALDDAAYLGDPQWRQLVRRFQEQRRPTLPPAALALVAAPATASAVPTDSDVTRPDRPPRIALAPDVAVRRQLAYDAAAAKNILDLQRDRIEIDGEVRRADGVHGHAVLINLAPEINLDYLLRVRWDDETSADYHLTNVVPRRRDLGLAAGFMTGITLEQQGRTEYCDLWDRQAKPSLQEAQESGAPSVLLCEGRVLLRLPSRGRRSNVERVTDFLRDYVWGGEQITVFVRETFYRDAFVQTGELIAGQSAPSLGLSEPPPIAAIGAEFVDKSVVPAELGLPLRGIGTGPLAVGRWYPVAGGLGIWFSALQPRMLDPAILDSNRRDLTPLDEVERTALAYLVAFDLNEFELRFALGTDHPRLDWSDRVPAATRDDSLPGPDGIGDALPLVRSGIVPAGLTPRVAAAFIAGFKRSHGAFKYGDLSLRNHGSHYGFIENGVIYSKLQPGLATLLVTVDGDVQMRTWTTADDTLLPQIVAARQNGVAILEHSADPGATGSPGPYVTRWGPGNWSGSQDGRYRTLRSGICTAPGGDRGFLLYGYFSGATPSAMARVFESYGCTYAMLLDMNALEHTYLATYRVDDDNVAVAHLIQGMSVLDKEGDDGTLPRFLAFSDNRDFFYVLRREEESP